MPSAAHQIAIRLLAEQPELLSQLTERLLGRPLAGPLRAVDSTLRFVETEEARPDLLLEGEAGWVALEVQGQIDPAKARRWLVMMAVKASQARRPGDLIVLTHSRAVAEWAPTVALQTGPLGTVTAVRPVVVLLSEAAVPRLLDADHPALAFFAVWAIHHRHGPAAKKVVDQAAELKALLPNELQLPMERAIMQVLNNELLQYFRRHVMRLSDIPLSPTFKRVFKDVIGEGIAEGKALGQAVGQALGRAEGQALGRAEGQALGRAEGAVAAKVESVLAVMAARGVSLTDAQRSRVLACRDLSVLNRYLRRAATASDAAEVLRPPSRPRRPRPTR